MSWLAPVSAVCCLLSAVVVVKQKNTGFVKMWVTFFILYSLFFIVGNFQLEIPTTYRGL